MSRAASFATATAEAVLGAGLRALAPAPALPAAAPARLLAYLAELHKWNASYNLTAIRDPAEMVTRHVLDSLSLLPLLPHEGRLLDVGSGGGIPGLILAIACPSLQVTVLDSNGKKARFMRHAVRSLGLDNAQVVEARAEDYRPEPRYPIVLSRAFAALAEFVACTEAALADDGRWLAMKGKVADDELAALPPAMILHAVHPLSVPGLAEARCCVELRRAGAQASVGADAGPRP